jgi:hypothetical protein
MKKFKLKINDKIKPDKKSETMLSQKPKGIIYAKRTRNYVYSTIYANCNVINSRSTRFI